MGRYAGPTASLRLAPPSTPFPPTRARCSRTPTAACCAAVAAAPDGVFRLLRLPAGANEVKVAAPGFLPVVLTIDRAAGGAPPVVRLARGALLRVSVVDREGALVPSAPVTVRAADADPASDPVISGAADHRGVHEARVPAGRFGVSGHGAGTEADVAAAEGAEVPVRLAPK